MSMRTRVFLRAILVLAMAVVSPIAFCANVTWDRGGGNDLWSVAANWDTNTVPGNSDIAFISNALDSVQIDVNANVNSIRVENGATVTIQSGKTVTQQVDSVVDTGSKLVIDDGTFQGPGTLHLVGTVDIKGGTLDGAGPLLIYTGGELQLSASTSNSRLLRGTFNNDGTITFRNTIQPGMHFRIGTNITNGSVIDIQTDHDVEVDSGTPVLTNNTGGVIKKSAGSGSAAINFAVDNTAGATIEAQSGTLALNNGGAVSGAYSVSSGATLSLLTGTFTTSGSPTLTGPGIFSIAGGASLALNAGTFTMSGSPTVSGSVSIAGGTLDAGAGVDVTWTNVNLSSGSITGAGTVRVSGTFNWTGGTIAGGLRVLNSGSVPTISCSAADCLLNGATLQVQASATFSASTNELMLSNGANLILDAGTTLSITASGDFLSGGGSPSSITNNGTIWKKTNFAVSIIGVPVTLSGTSTVDIDTGTVQFGDGASVAAGATLDIDASRTLEVTGGVFLFNSGTVVMPLGVLGGTFKVSSGTLRVPTGVTLDLPNVTLQGSGVIDGGGTLILSGTSTWIGGTMGSATAPGGITRIDSGSTLNVNTAGTQTLTQSRIVRNNGTLHMNGNINLSGSATIENNDTIDGNGTIHPRVENNNGATVSVFSGTLSLNGGGTADGAYSISGGFLQLGAGTFTMSSTATVTGGGTLDIAGATLNAGAGVDVTCPNLRLLNSGTITGAGTVRAGFFTWFSGTISGSGLREIQSPSSISCSTGPCTLDAATFQMSASATFSATANSLNFSNGASLVILGGRTLNMTNNGTIAGNGTITNNGTITKSGGSGIGSISPVLDNSSSVTVTAGTLSLLGGGTHSGSFTATAPGTIAFDGGTHSIGGAVSGTGTMAINGATVTLNATGNAGGFNMSGGTLSGSGTLTLSNGGTWSGGTMTGSGTTAIAASKTLTVSGFPTLSGRTLDLGSGAKLEVTSQRLEVAGAATVTGSGTVRVNGGTLRVLTGVTQTIPNVTLSSGVIDGAGALHVSGNFTWSGGTVAGSGSRVLDSTSSPTINCSGGNCLLDGATLQLQATATAYSASSNALVLSNGASLVLDPGKGLDVINDGDFLNGGGAASSIVIGGPVLGFNALIRKWTTSGTSIIDVPVTMSGSFLVETGTLQVAAGVSVAAGAIIDYRPGATIDVTGGVFVFNAGSVSFPSNGDFKVSSGTLRVATGVTMNNPMPNVTLQGSGVIDGGGTLNLSGNFNWLGGTIAGSGPKVLTSASAPAISCSAGNCQLDGATLQLQAFGTYSASTNALVLSNGANLILDPGKTLNVTSDGDFLNGGGAQSSIVIGGFAAGFNGCIWKTGTTGTSVINVPVTMAGSFLVQDGTLQVAAGVSVSGGAIVDYRPGATIDVTGGVFVFNSGAVSFPFNGDFKVSGGTLRVATGVTMNNPMPNVTLQGSGVIDGGGTLSLSGTSTWSGGTMSGSGTTIIPATMSLGITAPVTLNSRTLQNDGTLSVSGDITGSGTIDNSSTLNVLANLTIGTVLNNSGLVTTSNALTLAGGGTHTGSFNVTTPGSLTFSSGTHSVSGGTISGTGTLAISGATVTVDNPFTVGALSVTAGTATLDANGSAGSFTMTGGTLGGSGTVTLTNGGTWSGGTMSGSGETVNPTAKTLSITAPVTLNSRTLQNDGTLSVSGDISGSGTIDNGGTLNALANLTIGTALNNSGQVVTSNALTLAGGGTHTGSFTVTTPGSLTFSSGTHSMSGGSIGGTGTLAVSGATVTVGSPFTIGALSVSAGTATLDANGSADAFTMTGGTLGGSGTVTLTNGGTWSNGTMSGSGETVNPAAKTLSITAPVTLSRTLQNDGTLSVSGDISGSGTIDNAGTLNVLADLTLGVTVNNSSQVATSNALTLAGGGTHTGSFNVTTPGSLSFASGTHSLSGGGSITGTGTLSFDGATATACVPINVGTLSVSAGTATLDGNGSADAFTMTGGTLGGSGMLTLTNGGTWSGGTMSGSGTTVNPATKTVSISVPVTLNSRTLQNDGTLTVSGDITGSGTIANNGTLDTTANLTLGTIVNNNGQVVTSNALSLAGGGTHTGSFTVTSPGDLSFTSGTHSLSGGGSITGTGTLTFNGATATVGVPVNAGALSVSAGTATLDGNGSAGAFTMTGGTLGGSGMLTLTNGGTWSGGTMSGSGATVNPATKSFGISAPVTLTSRTLQNDGTLSVNGNVTGSGTIVNNGTLDTAADVTIGAAVNNNGQIATTTLLSLGGNGVHSGTFTATAPGVIDFSGGTQTISGALAGTGTLRFSGAAATVTGTWSGMPIEVTGGSAALDTNGTIPALTLSGGTLTGSGDVTVSGPSAWSGGTIAGSGDFTFGTGATVTMPGTNAATLSRPLLNQGTINYTAASNGMVIAGVAVTNDGTVDIQSSQPITATAGTPPFVNHGTLKKSSGSGVMQFGAPLANSSQVQIESGTMEFGGTYTQTAGTTTILSGATLQTETLSVDGGTLTGNGTVAGTVDNNAVVAPGASPGTLTIDGDFVQSSDGMLKIELAGTTPGTQYDRVLVTGSVNLDGTLSVTTSGFTPAAGNAFQILTFGSRLYNSTFDVMNGLNGPGFVLVPTFRSDDLRLITTLEANLGVTAGAPPSAVLGSTFAYTVGVFNGGAADANSVSVTAALPANVTFTGATPPICTGAPNLVCSVGHLNHGSTAAVVISVTADALGAAPISVAATASEPDSHPANNTAAASTNITAPVADVAVAVTGAGSTIAGTKVIYTVTVSNSGPDTATDIAVTATASPGLTFSANSGACVGSFPCSIATLGAGQSATIHSAWDIAPSAAGNVQLTVNASAAADVNASNNSDIAVTNIGTCPDITIVAPEVMTTGLTAEATVAGFGGAAYHWSIVNGTIDKGAGTATIEFTAGEPGTTTLAVNVTGGGCSLSATVDVTVQPRCVGTAMPTAPADGATADAVVDFAWSVVDDASGYRLWLQQDGAPARNLGTALGTTGTRIIPPGTYQWYVETLFDGCASHESERRTLTILPAQDCATREKPQLTAPADELPATSAAVAFSWNAVPQALEYELWLALAGGAPTLIRNTSDTSYTAVVPPGRLEWYVRAIFAGCAATESAHRVFTYTPPPQCTNERPLLIAPAEGERLTSPVSFEWTRVSGAASYELYVDGELAATTTDPHASDRPLPRAERRWKVRARLGEGCGAADSAESRLVVIPPSPSCAPLGTPVLSAPARISSGTAGRIQWTFVSGATAYEVEISGDPEFPRGATSSSTVTARQLPVTFTNQGSAPVARYLRVHAVDTSCVEPKIGAFSPVAELFVLPPTGNVTGHEGAAMMTDPTDVQYTLSIAAELAGQSFTAKPTVPWLSVTPASGVVPPGGQTLRAVAQSAGLPAGTNIGTVEITTTDNTAAATSGALKPLGTTTSSVSLSLNNIFGVSNAAKSTPPGDALIIPAVANVTNFVVRYESDISVTNTSAEPMTYEINFVPTGAKGISEGKKTKSPVPPGATMFVNDIVDTWFGGQSSTGTLEIRPVTETATSTSGAPDGGLSDRTTFAASRTFSTTDDVGTYGQYIPAVPYGNFVAKGRTLSLQQIAQSDKTKVHTNLGLVEGSGEPVSLLVRIFDAAGTMQASFPRDLNGGEQLQLNSVLKEHGLDDLADGRIEVEVTSETGKVTAYASVIDDRTRDAQLVPAVTLDHPEHSKWVVPGVTGSGNWQTDVRIFNAGTEAANLTLAFHSMNGGPPTTKTIQLKAGEVQQLDRVLSFFGLSGDTGALHVSSTAPAQVVVTARTYQQTDSGSFGQFIVAGTLDDAVSAGAPRPLQILQMEESADYQSIIGLAEVSGEPVTLKVEVLRPKPNATVGMDVELKPNEFRQIDLASFGLGDVYNARISVSATGGNGQALAYGSLIDRKTGDPTYIPGQR